MNDAWKPAVSLDLSKATPAVTEWAAKINASYGRAVDSFIETGLNLIAAKQDLSHGDWVSMLKIDLKFSPRTASVMMLVARRFNANGEFASKIKDLPNRQALADLPSAVSILEILASFSENELDAMIAVMPR